MHKDEPQVTVTIACAALAALALGVSPIASALATDCSLYVRAGFVPMAGMVADGVTPATAFDSIGTAAGRLRNPGEVVCVGPGVYREGNITPSRSGVSGFPVVLRAEPSGVATGEAPGPVVVRPPPGLPPGSQPTAAFRLLGQRNLVIEGFEIEGFFDAGIQVRSDVRGIAAEDVTIRNNDVRLNTKAGIDISGGGVVIVEGNRVLGNGRTGVSIQHCGEAEDPFDPGLRCRGATAEPLTPIVSNNRVGVNGAHGLFLHAVEHAVVQNNIVFSNGADGISARSAADCIFLNNLVYDNAFEAIGIGQADQASPNAVIANNTLYANGSWGISIGSRYAPSPGALVVNNILARNGDGLLGIGVQSESDFAVPSTCGYVAGFNLVADEYGPKTPWNVYDIRAGPGFDGSVEGPDGILGGYMDGGEVVDGSQDDRFYLQQSAADPAPASRGIDAGSAAIDELGLTGSTAADGRPDTGRVDLGFHHGASAMQVASVPAPFMPLYVRGDGDDGHSGKRPASAFATITAAARRARAGVSIVVGPGVYQECDLGPPPDSGKSAFIADSAGERTGDPEGPVLVDAGCCRTKDPDGNCTAGETGFNLPSACHALVDGFHIRRARDDGIQIQAGSHWAEARNNVTFSNQKRGIQVVNAHDVRIINNLAYDNGGGIQVTGVCRSESCEEAGSLRATIEHNTCYANSFDGLLLGAGAGSSSHATVRYNIFDAGGGEDPSRENKGFSLGSNTSYERHLEGFTSSFNVVVGGRYGAGTPRAVSDRVDAPLFVDPSGFDGILGGDGFADDAFQLQQFAAGDTAQSPAVDFSDITAAASGLAERSTRSDGGPDVGMVDLGFHYAPEQAVRTRTRRGDCDEDGRVGINDLVRAVGIALGQADPAACSSLDANNDGAVSIDELLRAVRIALVGG